MLSVQAQEHTQDIGYTTSSNGAMSSGGATLYEFKETSSSSSVPAQVRSMKPIEDTTYTKGTTQYSDVKGTTKTAYPNNGKSGSYWYVYKGIY